METPKCCNKSMELKAVYDGSTFIKSGDRLWFQCKKCGITCRKVA